MASLCAQARTCKGQTCTGSWGRWLERCAQPAPHTDVCHAPNTAPLRSQRNGQKYTKGMKTSGITWDNETMFNWLTTPKAVIKGAASCQGVVRAVAEALPPPSGRRAACPMPARRGGSARICCPEPPQNLHATIYLEPRYEHGLRGL